MYNIAVISSYLKRKLHHIWNRVLIIITIIQYQQDLSLELEHCGLLCSSPMIDTTLSSMVCLDSLWLSAKLVSWSFSSGQTASAHLYSLSSAGEITSLKVFYFLFWLQKYLIKVKLSPIWCILFLFRSDSYVLLRVWNIDTSISHVYILPPSDYDFIYLMSGILTSCSTDYLSTDWNNRSYGIFIFLWCYFTPLTFIIYAYLFIVKTVVAHEAVMAAQAKKMNVDSLRSGVSEWSNIFCLRLCVYSLSPSICFVSFDHCLRQTEGESAEMRVAKVAIFNVTIWLICWTPYCFVTIQVRCISRFFC